MHTFARDQATGRFAQRYRLHERDERHQQSSRALHNSNTLSRPLT